MSTKIAELIVEIEGRSTSLADVLRQTKSQLKETADQATKAGDQVGKGIGGGADRARTSVLSLAQAEARLAREQGDIPRSISLINGALASQEGRTVGVINAERQLLKLEQDLAKQRQTAANQPAPSAAPGAGGGGLAGQAAQLGGPLGQLAAAAGPVAAGMVAIKVAEEALDFAKTGAEAQQVRVAFDGLAKQAGTTGDALLGALRKASAGTISDLNLQLAANRAQLLGVASSAEQFSTLMEIARDRAQKMGISATQAFNDLVTGLGRGSALILDNLGITVKLGPANEAYAKSIGKTVAALSDEEKKQALINAVLAQGKASIDSAGGAAETNATKFERMAAAMDNLKAAAAGAAANILAPAIDGASQIAGIGASVEALGPKILGASKTWDDYRANVQGANAQLGEIGQSVNRATAGLVNASQVNQALGATVTGLSQAQFNYAQSLIATGTASDQAFAKAQQLGASFTLIGAVQSRFNAEAAGSAQQLDALSNALLTTASSGAEGAAFVQGLTQAFLGGRISAQEMQLALDQVAAGHQAAAAAAAADALEENQHANAMNLAKGGADQYTVSLGQQASAAIAATAQSQALAISQAAIAGIAQQAANGMITDAQAAAVLASNYGLATNEAYNLINAQRQLANAKATANLATLKATPVGRGADDDIRAEKSNQVAADRAARTAENGRRAAIDRELGYQKASNAEKLRLTRAELANTAAYSDKWVELKKREQSLSEGLDKKGRATAKAGGAAKLSDQQKLQNTLLTDAEKANDKFAAEDQKHYQKLIDIEKSYAEKSLAAQKKNEVDKRRSRFDFYTALSSATVSDGAAKQLANEYEEAFQKSQQLAAEGKQVQASEYLKMRQEQIQADLDYYKELGDAQKEAKEAEDAADRQAAAAKVQRLQELREMRKAAEAEELTQLQEGGDQNQNDRAKAIQDENRTYEEATGKIADEAEKSADRRIESNLRAGKAIDAEAAKVKALGKEYEQIGLAPATTSGVGEPKVASPSSTPAAPAGGALGPAEQISSVIDRALIDALGSASAAQLAKLDEVVAAVRAVAEVTADVGRRVSGVESAVRSSRNQGNVK